MIPSTVANKYLVYSPLRRMLFEVNSSAARMIEKYLYSDVELPKEQEKLAGNFKKLLEKEEFSPQKYEIKTDHKAVFVLTQKCNLACSYCYAQNARSQDTLDKTKIKAVVDFILSKPTKKAKEFSFIGGGEPTVAWEIFVWAVNYIKSKSVDQKISIGLTTNATLLDEKRINWLKSNSVRVGISFDILPEIQNSQRGFPNHSINSFEVVDKSIKLLISSGFTPRIRSTITKENVVLMPDMIEYVVKNYPEIDHLHFEQVTDVGLTQEDYYNKFITYFYQAKDIASANNIKLSNSVADSIRYIKTRFCGGEFCITPVGDLVSCHRISSREEELFDIVAYGHVDDKVYLEESNIDKIEKYANRKPPQCSECFAKWHCAGGCTHNKYLFSSEQFSSFCKFTKGMIARELERSL